jgi:hypothetical protein
MKTEIAHKQIVEIKNHLSNNSWSFDCIGEEIDSEKAMRWLERNTFGLKLVKEIVDDWSDVLEDKPNTFEMAQEIADDVAYAKLEAHGMISDDDDGYHLGHNTQFNLEII